ncbi:MAG: AmmeMemoRadiSam system protein B [Anaerolineaceae bacterium]|nr:AmmeMemoRadiSam system protein B [Anaerolineaceae bacterium]
MRQPIVADRFYVGTERGCLAHLQRVDVGAQGIEPLKNTPPVAAIVPHAGWDCSGRVAMKVFRSVQPHLEPGTTFILFGSVHSPGLQQASIYARGAWQTPLGPLSIDQSLAERLLAACGRLLVNDPQAHTSEHSIEVQLPMIRHVFGEVQIVPIAAPPREDSHLVGDCIARAAREAGGKVFFVGTTDLTHYGAMNYGFAPQGAGRAGLDWVKNENDPRMIRLMESLKADQVVQEARGHHNACGAGAIAATLAAAAEMGSVGGHLIEYTTSYDVLRRAGYGDQVGDFVGYAGLVF